jgi:hypothetical protein
MIRHLLAALTISFGLGSFAQVILTSTGTFIVPAGVDNITVELIGAGGSGASNGGGGGGGGGYARGSFAVTPATTLSIVVGEGGSELATIAGSLGMFANAGENATTVSNPNVGGGGVGGTGVGGQVNRTGGAGGGGYWTYFGGGGGGAAGPAANGGAGGNTIVYNESNCQTPGGAAGIGGGSPAGDGGKGAGFTDISCTVTNPGANGATYGGGGGGGNGIGSPVGIGGGGVCIISWSGASGVLDQLSPVPAQLVQNPVTDRILLRNTSGVERYQLLDPTGRMLWTGTHIETQDISYLEAGNYVLLVFNGDQAQRMKIVK